MLTFDVILILVTLVFILISLWFDLLGPGFTFLIAVTVLVIFGVLTPSEMLSGVANEHVAVVLALLLLGSIFEETHMLNAIFDWAFRGVKTARSFLLRLMLIISPLSAFLNNTPLVAIMIPYIKDWSRKNKVSASKLMIPLSYAAILGGASTLIGTGTNMIVNGMIADQKIFPHFKPLNIFDFTPVGGVMIVIGIIYILLVGYYLLPSKSRKKNEETQSNSVREYFVEVQIIENSPFINKRFRDLRDKFSGLYLYQIIRGNQIYSISVDHIVLQKDDILVLEGSSQAISELLSESHDLRVPSVGMFLLKNQVNVVEIVVSNNSWLINRRIKDVNFRALYDATAIAIHRNGEKIRGKISEMKIKPGDAILLLVGDKFWALTKDVKDFYVISKVKEFTKLPLYKYLILGLGTLLVIILGALKIVSLFIGVLALLIVLTLFKITTPKRLGEQMDYDLGFLLVMALAYGYAMMKTGAATMLADFIIDMFRPLGVYGLLAGIFIITNLIGSFITNKAAVAILFPIVLTIAKESSIAPIVTVLTMTYGATASFMTPIGYQTNTMVYGAGGYKFRDFIRIGLPLTIIYGFVAIVILSYLYM